MKTPHTIGRVTGALGLIALTAASHAQTGFNGAQSATYSGSSFSISGNAVSVNYDAAGTLNFGGGAVGLTGVRGLWIVSPSGGSLSGIADDTALASGATSKSGQVVAAWAPLTAPVGYDTAAGFAPKNDWITVGPGGKSSQYSSGVFNFTGLSSASNYDLGIDYLLANGNTGRAYFKPGTPSCPPPPCSAVPEPSTFALLGLGLPLAVLGVRRRKGVTR